MEIKFSITARSVSHFFVILHCAPNQKNGYLNRARSVYQLVENTIDRLRATWKLRSAMGMWTHTCIWAAKSFEESVFESNEDTA